jgi:hypothetical protein
VHELRAWPASACTQRRGQPTQDPSLRTSFNDYVPAAVRARPPLENPLERFPRNRQARRSPRQSLHSLQWVAGRDAPSAASATAEALFEVLDHQEVPVALLSFGASRRGAVPLAARIPITFNVVDHPLGSFGLFSTMSTSQRLIRSRGVRAMQRPFRGCALREVWIGWSLYCLQRS